MDERLELLEIELPLLDPDRVPGRPRFDSVRSQQLPQLRDVVLDSVRGGPGLLGSPQIVDEPIRRDHLVRSREQQSQHRPLTRPAEGYRRAFIHDFERPEDPEFHLSVLSVGS